MELYTTDADNSTLAKVIKKATNIKLCSFAMLNTFKIMASFAKWRLAFFYSMEGGGLSLKQFSPRDFYPLLKFCPKNNRKASITIDSPEKNSWKKAMTRNMCLPGKVNTVFQT